MHIILNVGEDEVPVKLLSRDVRKVIGYTVMELKEA